MASFYADSTDAERLAVAHAYFSAADVASTTQVKFNTLAQNALTAEDRSGYMANSLEAQRDLDLLKNQYRAYIFGQSPVTPPDDATIDKIRAAADQLASLISTTANAVALLNGFVSAKAVYDSIFAATEPATQ